MRYICQQGASSAGVEQTNGSSATITARALRRLRFGAVLTLALAAIGTHALLGVVPAAAGTATTLFVAPGGSDAVACSANSSTSPFASIQRALACAGDGDVVSLAPSGARPYPGAGSVGENVVIEAQAGANARSVVIDAGKGQLKIAPGASVSVSGVTLSCITSACTSPAAPTVTNEGTLVLSGDTISGNTSVHGGILNTTPEGSSTTASLIVEDSTVSGNVGQVGGGISSAPGTNATGALTLTIANSTIDGNFGASKGGGIFLGQTTAGSSAVIVNSTISGNSAESQGGGILATNPVSLSNTIIAANAVNNGPGADCFASGGALTDGSGGHNLIGDGSGCSELVDGTDADQIGSAAHPISPGLVTETVKGETLPALKNNGGPTDTVALEAASPAIGAGDPFTCESAPVADLDQRAEQRDSATRGCDVGAYDTAGTGGVVLATLFVAPGGSDAVACSASSSKNPFASIQRALGCAGDGDVVRLAPTGARPYPGIGTVAENVVIEAQGDANARTVVIDAGKGQLVVTSGASVSVTGVSLSCITDSCASPNAPTVTNQGRLTLSDDAVTGNGAVLGGIVNTTPEGSSTPASLTVEDSTVSGNVGKVGGGIFSAPGENATGALTLTIANSTIDGNSASNEAGGVFIGQTTAGSSATIVASTITGNSANNQAGGILISTPTSLSNTIVADNRLRADMDTDCDASLHGVLSDGRGGHNLIGNGSGCTELVNGSDGDQIGTAANPINPGLTLETVAGETQPALQSNGGPTDTVALEPTSLAIGAGSPASCEEQSIFDADQRGESRAAPTRDACDVGALDTGGVTPLSASALSPRAIVAGATKKLAVTLTGTAFRAGSKLSSSNPGISFSSVTVISSTTITAKEIAGAGVPAGSYDVTVLDPGARTTCTGCVSVEPPPTVSSLSPSSLAAGASGVPATIDGTGFSGTVKVAFSGPSDGVKARVVSATDTTVSVKISVAATAASGAYTLKVTDGNGASAICAGCLTIT